MTKSLKIVFFGNEHLATGIESSPLLFESLLKSNHQVVALVVHSSEKTSRSQKKEAIIELAENNGIPVFNPTKPIECLELLSEYGADCGVLAAYGKMVPQEVIDMFPYGIINLHPSLLPKLRGSTPIETVLLEGVAETGVSVMQLVKQMDAGPVYLQAKLPIADGTSKQQLADELHHRGAQELMRVLSDIDDAKLNLTEQIEGNASYCSLIQKADGRINWSESAAIIERKTRAYAGWPKCHTRIGEIDLVIIAADAESDWGAPAGTVAVDLTTSTLHIQCLNSSLKVLTLAPVGKAQMDVKDFLNGYKQKLLRVEQLEVRS